MTGRQHLPASQRVKAELRRLAYSSSDALKYGYRKYRHAKPSATRMLLLTDFGEYTSDQQYAPIMRNSREIYVVGNLNTAVCDLRVARLSRRLINNFDFVGLKLSYTMSPESALQETLSVRDMMTRSAKLVYFDGDDDLNVQWPEVVDAVDIYVKKHAFQRREDYLRSYVGKSNLSDYIATRVDPGCVDARFECSGPLTESQLAKISVGWNIGLDDRIEYLARTGLTPPWRSRQIDICGRASADSDDWLSALRRPMIEGLKRMESDFRVAVPRNRVPLSDYYDELRNSSICVSPFGWGEICWRDFEAILSGCLLVKPDMSHVSTFPNIYVPGETYVPIAWDYSDLSEVCNQYLLDDHSRNRIVERAQDVLLRALEPQWVVDRMRNLLDM